MKKILFMLMVSAALCAGCDDEHRAKWGMVDAMNPDDTCRQVISWCQDGITWYACEVGDEVEFIPRLCF